MEELRPVIPETPQRPSSYSEPDLPSPSSVPLLEHIDDWPHWIKCIRLVVRALGAGDLLEENPSVHGHGYNTKLNLERESCIQAFVRSRCGEAALKITGGTRTVYGMLAELSSRCRTTQFASEFTLFSELACVERTEFPTLEHYIARFRNCIGDLDKSGVKIDDKLQLYWFMAGLDHKDVDHIMANAEEVGPWRGPPAFDTVLNCLLQKEKLSGDSEGESMILGSGRSFRWITESQGSSHP